MRLLWFKIYSLFDICMMNVFLIYATTSTTIICIVISFLKLYWTIRI